MPGLDPGIHAFLCRKTWMAGTSPAMTAINTFQKTKTPERIFSPVSNCLPFAGFVLSSIPESQNAPSRTAPTNTNTAHTARTLSFKA
jgi:hypothetical protein